MKRLILALALGAAGLLSCSEAETFTTAAGISGAYDLTLVNRLVFVTSSDTDELRVLDLDANPRDYVRAPNPLEPLAIPVLDRPLALARDVAYDVNGQEVVGQYVYVRSAGSQEISVVGAAPELLRQVRRLVAPGIVTALAGRGPLTEGEPSQLFFATQAAEGARVWRQELARPDVLESTTPPAPVLVAQLQPGETAQALLVLPANQLAIATRSAAGRGGRTFRVDVTAPDQVTELRFGAPVRQLYTHPRVTILAGRESRPELRLEAGTRVYGILDEAACGGRSGCSGVLAVDSATGQVSRELIALRDERDANNQPIISGYREGVQMTPITVGAALPTGMTIAPNAQLLVVQGGARVIDLFPLLGILPASDGRITLFDAVELRHFDFDPAAAAAAIELRNAAEQPKDPNNTGRTLLTAEVVNGATQTDVYRLFYQARLQGLSGLGRAAGTSTPFEVPRVEAERASLQPGDILVLEGDGGACATELSVGQVVPGTTSTTLVPSTPIPPECADLPRFSVLAGGAQPFVVFSATRGVLGRMGTGQPFTVAGPYFRHPDEQVGLPSPVQVRLTLSELDPRLARDDRYVVATNGAFVPFIAEVNRVDSTLGLGEYRLPASVVFTKAQDGTDFAYFAYPSADGILQMNLEQTYFDQLNDVGLRTFQ